MIHYIAKSTQLERWLATHVRFFALRWQRNVARELAEQASEELEAARQIVILRANEYVDRFADPSDLIGAVCRYRNARAQWRKCLNEVLAAEHRVAGEP